jgi:hypothetical protein
MVMEQTHTPVLGLKTENAGIVKSLVSVWSSVGIGFFVAEGFGLNHFLRSWVQGEAYWYFLACELGALASLLSGAVLLSPGIRNVTAWKATLIGCFLGFPSSIAAILLTRPLVRHDYTSSLRVLQDPLHLVVASAISMGWAYAGIITFVAHSLLNKKYRRLAILLSVCACVGALNIGLYLIRRWT